MSRGTGSPGHNIDIYICIYIHIHIHVYVYVCVCEGWPGEPGSRAQVPRDMYRYMFVYVCVCGNVRVYVIELLSY